MRWARIGRTGASRDHYLHPKSWGEPPANTVWTVCGVSGRVRGLRRYAPREGHACRKCLAIWKATEER